MKLNILLFAGLVDKFGANTITVDVESESVTAGRLLQCLMELYPEHADTLKPCFFAKNQEYASPGDSLDENDELALIPPVSGGQDKGSAAGPSPANSEDRFVITFDPLDAGAVASKVGHADHGASLAFIGTTREMTAGERTVRLEYEAYSPMALKSLRQIGEEVSAAWPGVLCAISHRLGVVGIGEISVVIAVSAPHRDTCYDASRYAIERLKQIVPIWKKEHWENGSEWKGHQMGSWNPVE